MFSAGRWSLRRLGRLRGSCRLGPRLQLTTPPSARAVHGWYSCGAASSSVSPQDDHTWVLAPVGMVLLALALPCGERGAYSSEAAALPATSRGGAFRGARPHKGRRASQCSEGPPARRIALAREADFADGELRQVKVPADPSTGASEGAVLLARIDGKFYATGASCSHYSAPLAQGVAAKDKMHVVCPWHDAAFDLRTGQPVRGPALQAIPTYTVCVQDGNVVVDLPMSMEDFVAPQMAKKRLDDERLFVVVGGGAAGVTAVDALRQEGFTGRIMMLTEENHMPYDRPVLSKNLGKASDPGSLSLRDAEYFDEHEIEVKRSAKVSSLDASKKLIKLASGQEIRYDAALVATGAKPRLLPVPGGSLPGVLALRTPEDAQKISAQCEKGKRVLVIGSSFIGMEVAATLKRRGCEVTVLGMEAAPFERVLGHRLGASMKRFFESKGVTFIGKAVVSEVVQTGSGLQATTKAGQKLVCDAIVVGVGVIPNAGFVTGAEKARDGSLVTDEFLQCSAEGLFAAGDVATYRSTKSGQNQRVEHWDVAMSQGRLAAKSMAGKKEAFDATPFFWTSLFGKNLRYVGYCAEFDELLVDGDMEKLNFVAFYCYKGVVRAVATMARDPVAVAAGELMRLGRMPSVDDLKVGRSRPGGLASELANLCRADAA